MHSKLKYTYFIRLYNQGKHKFIFVDSLLTFRELNITMTQYSFYPLLQLHFSCWKLFCVPLGREEILNSTSWHSVSEEKNRFLKIYHEINIFPQVTSLITQPSSQKNSNWNAVWPFCLQNSVCSTIHWPFYRSK